MKTNKFLSIALIAFGALFLASCDDDDKVIPEPVVRGDKACRIESFVLKFESDSLIGDVYDYDKSIDVSYKSTQYRNIQSAYATVTLSEGATISPDPTVPMDYTQPISFTVTAKDGTTTRTYTTRPNEKVVQTYVKVSQFNSKTPTELGAGTTSWMGISGNYLVLGTKVYDRLTLASVGDLNMTGVDGQICYLCNDAAGHLLAGVTSNGGFETAPSTIYCWKDGYDKAPIVLLGPSQGAIGGFISACGDIINGNGIVTAVGGRSANGPHFCWRFEKGQMVQYYASLNTGFPSNDGSWAQMVSNSSDSIEGPWFMWDAVGGGANVGSWSWDGTSAIRINTFQGTVGNGTNMWGNYTFGAIRAFNFNDTPYAIVFTTGWPNAYISIVDQTGNAILNAADATIPATAGTYYPACTYIYNDADGCGYAYALVGGVEVRIWKLEIAEL